MFAPRDGRLRALGVAGKARTPLLPDTPTIAEAGVPGYEITNWFAMMAPAATPKDVLARIHADVLGSDHCPVSITMA